MSRILEVIFQRPIRLLSLVILLPIFSVAVGYLIIPHTYASRASLWSLRRYEIIGDVNLQPNPPPTPADTQVAALSALLQTRDFDLAVANESGLVTNLDAATRNAPQLRDDALFDEISKHVTVTSQNNNLFTIDYTNRDPQIAKKVVAAVIQNFGLQSVSFSRIQGQRLLENYQKQLAMATQDANAATAREQQYLAAHPHVTQNILYVGPQYAELFDPEYALLHTQSAQALDRMQQIQTQMATTQLQIAAQGSSADNLFKVIDTPDVADRPTGRTKLLSMVGGAALGIALLACTLYIIILVRGDRTLYTPRDLDNIEAYPIVMQLPYLTSKDLPRLWAKSIQNGAISLQTKNSH
ncbi:hypothetical protein EPA93_47725 [Ktedonosporobacter rubrisoli]|uniref:Polysaccharide chain length determinant N-terminal domain-containing protein n=1 Tax=Ktedonosporobacter rubrisoli TaxID=2509675 RepID=A0A4P6K5T9_KTERU|nr:hypothetical protein [Ktedonosporobacter rubrisoli]QBD83250.1 hypothetical protein EPA93_47725 [Ktedonosporobacter rubrisoli]